MNNKICKIEIEAFRGYDSKQIFDLTTKTGKPASLVVLYAPNGFGKTSFFDAVEWGLTGKIKRFYDNKVIKKSADKQRGRILHNYDSLKEKGLVEIYFENNYSIKRTTKLSKPGVDKWDYNEGKVADKQSLLNKDKTQLSAIVSILTQESGDQAICFTTPEGRFDALKSFWDNHNDTNIYKAILGVHKVAQARKESLASEINELEALLSVEMNESGAISRLNTLISELNSDVEPISQQFDLSELNDKQESITLLKNKLNEDIIAFNDKIQAIQFLTNGYDSHLEREKLLSALSDDSVRVDHILKGISQLKQYIEKLEKLNKDLKQENYFLSQKYDLKNIIEDYLIIDEGIQGLIEHNNDANINLQKERQLLVNLSNSIIKLRARLRDLKISLEKNEDAYNELNKLNSLHASYKKQIEFYKKRKELAQTLSLNRKQAYNSELDKINIITRFSDISRSFIEQVKISIPKELEKDFLELQLSVAQVREAEIRFKSAEEATRHVESMQEALATITSLGKYFVEQNKDESCPLCSTKFEDQKLLLLRIQSQQASLPDANKSQERLAQEGKNLKNSNDNFEDLINAFRFRIQRILNEMQGSLTASRDALSNTESLVYYYQNLIQLNTSEIDSISLLTNISINDLSEKSLNDLLGAKSNALATEKNYYQSLLEDVVRKEEEQDSFRKSILNKENEINQTRIKVETSKSSFIYKNALELIGELKSSSEGLLSLDVDISESEHIINLIESDIKEVNVSIEELNTKFGHFNEISLISDLDSIERKKNDLSTESTSYIKALNSLNFFDKKDLLEILQAERVAVDAKITSASQQLEIVFRIIAVIESTHSHIDNTKNLKQKNEVLQAVTEKLNLLNDAKTKSISYIKDKIALYFDEDLINEIYQKIEPHPTLKHIKFVPELEGNKPGLDILVSDNINGMQDRAPVIYFSAAQVNILSLSIFLAKALRDTSTIVSTIFLDDPIQFLDSINMLSFIDLVRTIISDRILDRQLFISTHDENFFKLLQRKIDADYYDSRFIELETFGKIKSNKMEANYDSLK